MTRSDAETKKTFEHSDLRNFINVMLSELKD